MAGSMGPATHPLREDGGSQIMGSTRQCETMKQAGFWWSGCEQVHNAREPLTLILYQREGTERWRLPAAGVPSPHERPMT